MPPADRKNPKRSVASESRYSLVEFMRDFPDDEACLNWLWRTRCAVGDESHAHWRYNHRDDGRSMFALLILRAALTN